MRFRSTHDQPASPARLLEMLSDRFAALEAVAYSSDQARVAEPELSMDLLVASAVLEFADDLRAAGEAAEEWRLEQPA